MFLGASLVALSANVALVNFLSTQLPDQKDPDGVFDQPFKEYYDYIVVGAGSAGSIVATRLSEDPVSVLLLEAGGSDYDNEFTRIPLPWLRLLGSKEDWGFSTVPQEFSSFAIKDRKVDTYRGKVLGGTGSINGMNYIRGNRHDYDQWGREGCTGWSYKDVLPYFTKSENIQIPELMNSSYHGKNGPLVITGADTTPLAILHKMAAEEKEIPSVDCNGHDQIGFCNWQANIKDGERCSSASCFLRPVLQRHNLQVAINSHVVEVILQNGTATGVKVLRNGTTTEIYAKEEVILSAGVFGSPQILLLSGIGPKEHLQELQIPVKVDLPVGEGLQDPMQYFFQYTTNTSLNINKERGLDQKEVLDYVFHRKGIQTYPGFDAHLFAQLEKHENNLSYPDLQLSFLGRANEYDYIKCAVDKMNERGEFGKETRTASVGFELLIYKLHHKSRGTVRLKTKNPLDPPLINPKYLSHTDDVDSYVKILRYVQDFANNTAWKSIGATFTRQEECDGYCTDLSFDTDEYWKCMVRHYAHPSNHQTSTCRMGAVNDSTAVVDPYLRVKGITNLRIVDASVMRNVPSGNTNAACMMIAEKAADMIKYTRNKKSEVGQ